MLRAYLTCTNSTILSSILLKRRLSDFISQPLIPPILIPPPPHWQLSEAELTIAPHGRCLGWRIGDLEPGFKRKNLVFRLRDARWESWWRRRWSRRSWGGEEDVVAVREWSSLLETRNLDFSYFIWSSCFLLMSGNGRPCWNKKNGRPCWNWTFWNFIFHVFARKKLSQVVVAKVWILWRFCCWNQTPSCVHDVHV